MSKIVAKLREHQRQQKAHPGMLSTSKGLSKVVLAMHREQERLSQSIEEIAKRWGTDDELDLLPISLTEDYLFCFEGSPVAAWTERRLQDPAAEEWLKLALNKPTRLLCPNCLKLNPRCICTRSLWDRISSPF